MVLRMTLTFSVSTATQENICNCEEFSQTVHNNLCYFAFMWLLESENIVDS